jgi:para-nitrobenzyl esterase
MASTCSPLPPAWTIGVLLLLGSACTAAATQNPLSVRIEGGQVVGTESGGVRVFRALPFAAPPVGPLRWQPPAPVPAWTGIRTAGSDGPACPQRVREDGRPNEGGYAGPTSEDCLTLNVWTPMRAARAPVMVWLYGGANTFGADNLASYDGAAFARDGVVLVTVNYRLGALGFFAHPALTAEAPVDAPLVSYGLMDQIAALRWVQRNIAAFGGDPGNVTVFGESAGGIDVLDLLAIPSARGSFSKAIVESGWGWDEPVTLAEREAQGTDLAAALGLSGAEATAAALRAVPVEKIIAAQTGLWGPAVDGRLIRETSAQAFARGDAAPVPLMIGSNSFEASLLVAFPIALPTVPESLRAAYAGEAADERSLRLAMFNDGFGAAPARWIAAQSSARAPAYLYYFSYLPIARRSLQRGANHASEIPYVFDSLEKIPGRAPLLTDSDHAMATLMHGCWTNFAKTGAPTCTAGGRPWRAYTPADDELMEFGIESGPRQHFRKAALDAQEALFREHLK